MGKCSERKNGSFHGKKLGCWDYSKYLHVMWCLGEDLGGWTDTCKPLIKAFPDPSGFYGPNPTASVGAEAELIYSILCS